MAHASQPVAVAVEEAGCRFSLRAGPDQVAAVSDAFGAPLPGAIGERAAAGTRSALRLGPDEWVLWGAEADAEPIRAAFAALRPAHPHSLVETGDRERTIVLSGAAAARLLAVGCPLDLEAMAVGRGTRTVFDGAVVVMVREAPDRFRLDVWRSFAPHVLAVLELGNAELAAGL